MKPSRTSPITLLLALLALLVCAGTASASIVTVGPRLSRQATLDTSQALGYPGTNTAVPVSPEAPTGVVHTAHFGADTAIWNTSVEGRPAAMPHAGQAVAIKLEGCAVPAPGDPTPLDQIHFQTLTPQGGGIKVELSSASFTIPTCGEHGAGSSTVTTYRPYNLCVDKGDYVGFNDEGGFAPPYYRAGVPYRVLGSVRGDALVSFIRGDGTGNGAIFLPSDKETMEGWATSRNVGLMMDVELGTGADARYVCPTGTKEAPRVFAPMRISRQTDGINRARVVAVAIYCRPATGCHGGATLELPAAGRAARVGSTAFSLPGNATSHLPIRVSPQVLSLIHRDHRVGTVIVAQMGGRTFVQHVTIAIL